MPKFALNNEFVPVSVYFIENCLKNVSGSFLKVYLYSLGLASKGMDADTETIAKELDMLESDVLQAFNYWKSVGMIIEDEGVVEFLTRPQQDELFGATEQVVYKEADTMKKSTYDSVEVAKKISESNSLSEMVQLAQELLAKPLSPDELETLFWLNDELGFSAEAVLLLLDYCISREKRNMRYIEKVAISWHEQGIISPEDIMEHIASEEEKNTTAYKLRKAMGIADRPITAPEEAYLNKWCEEFKIPEDMIILAYESCLLNTSKLSFPYMDKIIERWHSQGIMTRAQAEEDNQKYKKKSTGANDIYKDKFSHPDLEALTRNKD